MPVLMSKSEQMERVWIYEHVGKWTWNEAYHVMDTEIEQANHQRYDVIGDLRPATNHPPNLVSVFGTAVKRRALAGGRLTVVVTENIFLNTMSQIFRRVYPKLWPYLRITNSMEKAYEIIRADRSIVTNNLLI
jgi:hypothetical protein